MKYEIIKNPVGLIEFTLNRGESITGEAGSMSYLKGDIITRTKMRKGGFFKTLKTVAFGGESFFVNEFVANEDGLSSGPNWQYVR
ncbi:AIM24 family protein [Nitrosopumilus sp.]|uniref:AIM24 family protein n=1 Tax=Nitrosopumilus sp. TaxID=2024843 RepID=UPI0029313BAA|nr:AIM24 family protein [Nitrosopumilus sp.]